MAAIVYLDVDDEITSAAARIRSSDETRVVLVVPYGSRLATSRINFRLLAREAQTKGRTLAIVAPDAATRALAGSAGLDTFGAVAEYEASLPGATPATPPADIPPARPRRARRSHASPRDPGGDGADAEAPTLWMPTSAQSSAPTLAAPSAATPASPREPIPTPSAVSTPAPTRPSVGARATVVAPRLTIALPALRGIRRPLRVARVPLAVGAAIAALAILVTGVGAYLLLPTATIVLTPRVEAIGPVPMTITADPEATAPDTERAIIPAERLSFDLVATDSFAATGKRIEADPAIGQVTFENYDPTARNVVPAGSIVSTEGGIRFRTTAAVSVPAGTFVLPEVVPGKATIGVQAVRPGPEGNVPANSITVVPSAENPIFLRVRNREPTAGGARREFSRVSRADIDGALAALTTQLGEQFDALLADPATTPEATTLFAETQRLSEGVPTTDPELALGQEIESFELSMTATGTVIAVDSAPVAAVADARVRENVTDGYELVEGSIVLDPGDATVADELVLFPVTAQAEQTPIVDEAGLLAEIKGKPILQARTFLEGFGQVAIDAWPDWVTSIPTLDARLDLRIQRRGPVSSGPAAPFASPSATP